MAEKGITPQSAATQAGASSVWTVWQLVDASYPTGGFAHSAGLESAWQQGAVSGPQTLAAFIQASLLQLAETSVPFATAVHAQPDRFAELDDRLDALTTSQVTNRASRRQGQALLSTSAAVFGGDTLHAVQQTVAQSGTGHLATVFGAVASSAGIARGEAVRMMLFMLLRDEIAAAVRIGLVGSRQGQRLQHELGPEAERLAVTGESKEVETAGQPTPFLELAQSNHQRLYSRLFQS